MLKVRCINNDHNKSYLVVDKIYNAVDYTPRLYEIYYSDRFGNGYVLVSKKKFSVVD